MKLDEVELQQTTGSMIAKGSLRIESEVNGALGSVAYDHLLFSSEAGRTTIWPVTGVTRDEYGFCEATFCEVGLAFRSLSLNDIGWLSSPGAGFCSLARGGSQAGELRRRVRSGDGWIEEPGTPIDRYELRTEYGREGLHVVISGQIAAAAFSVDTTIAWPTLAVKGIGWSSAYWKFGHPQGSWSKLDTTDRPRDSRKLTDLLLSQGLSWPYLKGRISFTPEPSGRSDHDFVYIQFHDHISFGDAPHLKVLDTGFVSSLGSNR